MKRAMSLFMLLAVLLASDPLFADDLEIFGGAMVNLNPNVLIVFDNSSSMMCCTSASCSPPSNCSTLANQRLYVAKDAIKKLVNRVTGVNFGLMVFNSNSEGGRLVRPLGTDKAALISAIDSITTTSGSTRSSSANAASSIVAGDYTYTPLAETLAEAGLYYAGQNSWFDTAHYTTYTSPITQPCQKNYIIVITDGAPTNDNNSWLSSGSSGKVYVNGVNKIGNYDQDDRNGDGRRDDADETSGYSTNGSDYLDDIAKYLYDNDIRPNFGSGDFVKQNVKTYTIGFTTTNSLLNDTAFNGGTGSTRTASDTSSLDQAFNEIIAVILDANAIYAPPAIPRNPSDQIQAGSTVYMPFFKPKGNGRWIGNLKAYTLANGVLMDAVPVAATYPVDPAAAGYVAGKEGNIKETAQSLWQWTTTSEKDGLQVDSGGAGKLLAERPLSPPNERKVYTYIGESLNIATHPSNQFTATSNNNPKITAALLGVADATSRNSVIDETLRGVSITLGETATQDYWPLGDIIHSGPLVRDFEATYQNGVIDVGETAKSYLFVGANDGMLHVFNTANGKEEWALVPPGQLARLKYRTSVYSGGEHYYFVDGSPVIERVTDTSFSPAIKRTLLIFGERRGGKRYYALDIDNVDNPVWKYQVSDQDTASPPSYLLGGAAARLGQSWAVPQFNRVRSAGQVKDVFLLAGGYDTNQDLATPAAADTSGRAIYTIQADTGAVFGLNINAANWMDASTSPATPYMTHSIVDVTGFDATESGFMNRVYAGDLGGRIFGAKYKYDSTSDAWEKLVLLNLPASATYIDGSGVTQTYSPGRKFMTRPDATIEVDGECLYLGTGDREHLTNTDRVDAFYAVCNRWQKLRDVDGNELPPDVNGIYSYEPVPFGSLADVTDNLIQDGGTDQADAIAALNATLQEGYGWFIRMEHDGEKITSTPKVIDGKVFFTTFTPDNNGASLADPCNTSFDLGVSRLYAVDFRTGAAVLNFDDSDDVLTKDDRSTVIGTSLAPDLLLTTIGEKTVLVTGSGGKFLTIDVSNKSVLRRYYWRQIK